MKRATNAVIAALCAAVLVLAAACGGGERDGASHTISVSWSEGVEGVNFTQDGERLFPRNGKIATVSDGEIEIEVDLRQGYRQNEPVLKVDGAVTDLAAVPATAQTIEITARPNENVVLTLGEGTGYRLDELKRVPEEVGYTSIVGIYLEEGYREVSPPKVSPIVVGAAYEAVSSLAEWQLDAGELKRSGYHSFYRVRVLENTTIGVTGVVPDPRSEEEYATVRHAGGEGYTLRALIDTNHDGIGDLQQVLAGEATFVKGTVLDLMIYRDSSYSTADAKLFANGTEVIGTQGEGADDSDPLSNELVYCVTLSGDVELTVTGVKKLGMFTLHIMNADGTQRYRTFCRADRLSEGLAQVPGNDARGDAAYSKWWEPDPGDGYAFRYWHFTERGFEEIGEAYAPNAYEDLYCGYVREGTTPDDPMDRPTVPAEPEKPDLPDDSALPQSLKDALANVASLQGDELLSKQWVLAWAAYQLYRAGAADLGRPAVFRNGNIYDDWYDDLLPGYIEPAANNLWAYAYDMLKTGSSEISLDGQLRSSFLKPAGGKRSWANNEALVIEIVGEIFPEFECKRSFTIGKADDLNFTFVLLLDRLGVEWSLFGTPVETFTEETYRAYAEEHASEQVMANAVKEVFAYLDSLGN